MNEEFNPYAQQPSADNPYANPQTAQPQYQQYQQQPPQYQEYPQQPPQYPQYPQYQQNQQYQQYQPYPYQQQYYYTQQRQGNKSAGMAKAFSIVSFVTGCISMLVLLAFGLILLIGLETSYLGQGYSAWASEGISQLSLREGLSVGLPGVIFGIIALAKKTKLSALAVMGVVFNGVLLLSMLLIAVANL